VADLLAALEEVAPGAVIYPTTIYDGPTISELAAVLRGERSPSTAVLVPLRTGGTAPPSFLVHPHTGGIGMALALSRHLGDDRPFYGLQAVGLAGEREPLTSIEAMAAELLKVVRDIQPQGPYHLGGICFGGVVAFEMAQQLVAVGESVASLFLGEVTPEDFPALVPAAAWRRFRRQRLWQLWKTRLHNAGQRPARERLPALVKELRVDFWQYRMIRTVGRHLRQGHPLTGELRSVDLVNKAAFSRYVPRPYPGRATLVLRSEDRKHYRPSPAEVWKRLAERGVEIHLVPGGDGAMWREPGVKRTAELLLAAMDGPPIVAPPASPGFRSE
jgi:acetoacetyl-CoA synthetase